MATNHQSIISNQQSARRGFTLVELLVVIAIIAVLASLLVVAVTAARRAAQETAIQTDCIELGKGFDNYINDISGGSYPPNLTTQITNQPNALPNALIDFKRHLNKAFPNHREPADLIDVLAIGIRGNNTPNQSNATLVGSPQVGLTPHEAIVFWLGGFSKDPKYPISGPGGPSFVVGTVEDFASRTGYSFDETRLGPRDASGFFDGRSVTYRDTRTGQQRQINFWLYYPRGQSEPYAYFDASRRPLVEPAFGPVAPIKMLKLGAANVPNPPVNNIRLANEGKCQILSAGLDDSWGNLTGVVGADWPNPANPYQGLLYPDGPWVGELADNIVNFSEGRTLEDSQP